MTKSYKEMLDNWLTEEIGLDGVEFHKEGSIYRVSALVGMCRRLTTVAKFYINRDGYAKIMWWDVPDNNNHKEGNILNLRQLDNERQAELDCM